MQQYNDSKIGIFDECSVPCEYSISQKLFIFLKIWMLCCIFLIDMIGINMLYDVIYTYINQITEEV